MLHDHTARLKLPRIAAAASAVVTDPAGATITYAGGEARVRLVVGADGQRSMCRAAAGIGTHRRAYPQTALILNLGHARPHADISTEFHTATGPFTLVPLPGRRSSLVCVLDPASAAALYAMPDAALSAEIERRAHSLLGAMTAEPGRGMFALAVETAQTFARGRIALVGEAAHVVPPIGAQGLNLGLRDAATLGRARRRRAPPKPRYRQPERCSPVTTPSAAPTRPAGGSPSISSTAASSATSSRCKAPAACRFT